MSETDPRQSGIRALLEYLASPAFDDRLRAVVSPYLDDRERTVVAPLPLARHIGHFGPEPHYLKTIFGRSYDRIALITPPRREPGITQGLFDLLGEEFMLIETDDKAVLNAGILNQGVTNKGGFDFYGAQILRFYRDYGLMRHLHGPLFLGMSPALLEKGRAWLAQLGLTPDSGFVLLHVRDKGYVASAANRLEGEMRATSLGNVRPAVDWLAGEGMPVFRIGGKDDEPLDHPSDIVFDVAKMPDREDWMDVFLCGACRFSVNCQSGPEGLVRAFDRPSLTTNLLPTVLGHHRPDDLFLYKSLFRGDASLPMSYEEILAADLPIALSAVPLPNPQVYADMAIRPVENSPGVILCATQEIYARCSGTAPPEPSDLKKRFLAASRAYQAKLEQNPEARARNLDLFTHALGWGSPADAQGDEVPNFV
ncbi:TIGR04372 family glycosyltransferase [Nisaea sediminum]|uniref:TIGR04372 family glycosyltransferase n=1 Tax=Nisaea sediminum TaxID=2775867 RepID=UPI0018662C47|nr:TIGR04372 family glycosyltransferase [Nisaea sediminum]